MTEGLRWRFERAARELVAPGAANADSAAHFDREAFRELGRRGLLRALGPGQLGGEGLGLRGLAQAIAGLASGSQDLGFTVAVMAHGVATQLLVEHGSEAQHARWLPRLLSGEWLAGVANAEPRAGTDVLALRSRARRVGDGFVVSGRKRSITNVGQADLLLVSARLAGTLEQQAINAFVVELPTAGAHQRPITDLVGLRSSPTGDLLLRHARLPDHALLGPVGAGVELFRTTFSWERLLSGYLFLSVIQTALARALDHAEERAQFGQAIGRNQHVQERVVRMHVAGELLEAHLDATLEAACAGRDVFGALSVIKVFGLEAALEAAQSLVRLLGGRGLRRQAGAERLLRDAMTLSVFGGTVELHKSIAYTELARHRLARQLAPELEVVPASDVSPALARELIGLASATFPDHPEFRHRYYFDTPPDELVLARRAGRLVGFRTIAYRNLELDGRIVSAAGIGVAVAPEHQRSGVGTALTQRALELARGHGTGLVLAFLFSPAAEPLLRAAGFRELRARISYRSRDGQRPRVETAPCLACALDEATLLDSIEARGELDLGVGAL